MTQNCFSPSLWLFHSTEVQVNWQEIGQFWQKYGRLNSRAFAQFSYCTNAVFAVFIYTILRQRYYQTKLVITKSTQFYYVSRAQKLPVADGFFAR